MHDFEPLQRRFNIGDIVTCEDEGDRLFRISGYQVTVYFDSTGMDKDLMYDLVDAITYDMVMPAVDEELTLVISAENADEFISNRQRDKEQPKSNDIHLAIDLDCSSDRELIDMLLDKYNDYMAVSSDLKGVAPTAAIRKWKKDAKEILAELRGLMGGDVE